MENKQQISRYPGVRPFETNERMLFKGRDTEIKEFCDLIKAKRFAVLFAKSGTGKTSLLNAGVLPLLNTQRYSLIRVRFQDFDKSPAVVFRETVERFVKSKTAGKNNFISQYYHRLKTRKKELQRVELLLWEYLKSYDIERVMTPKKMDLATRTPIVIFDQFEEFFYNNDKEGQKEFVDCLADLLYGRVPDKILDEQTFSMTLEFSNTYTPWLLPLDWKVIISIRSDRLFRLDELSPQIPAILNNRYGLLPLTREQARQAIVLPAEKQPNCEHSLLFKTVPFGYSAETLEHILDGLSNSRGEIESFELQIVCEHIELEVAKLNVTSPVCVNDHYLTNEQETVKEGINRIIHNYYQDKISLLGTNQEKAIIQKLLEEGLIMADTRISLPKKVILTKFNVSETLLNQLVATRLIREKKIFYDEESVYEIAHDTLIPPILDSLKRRQRQEEKKKQQQKLFKLTVIIIFLVAALLGVLWLITQLIFAQDQLMNTNNKLEREKSKSDNLNEALISSNIELKSTNNELDSANKNLLVSSKINKARSYLAEALLLMNSKEYSKAFNLAILARDLSPSDPKIIQVLTQAYYQTPYEYGGSYYAPPFPKELEQKDAVDFVAIAPEGNHLLMCSRDHEAILWNSLLNSNIKLHHKAFVNRAVFSPNGKKILTCSDDSTAAIWNTKGQILQTFQHAGMVNLALFSPDGEKIVTASSDKKVRVWSVRGKLLGEIPHTYTRGITQIAFSPNGQKVLVNTHTNTIGLWDWAQGQLLFMSHPSGKRVNRVSFAPNGQYMVAICDDGSIILWNKEGKIKLEAEGHTKGGLGVVVSPNSKQFVSVSMDHTAQLRDSTGLLLHIMKHNGAVLAAAFSPNGNYIATTSEDKITRIWDNKGNLITKLYEHQNRVNWVGWNNNSTLTTISSDNTVKVWNVTSKPIVTLHKHSAMIHTMDCLRDGNLLSGGQDGQVVIWSKNGINVFAPFQSPFSIKKASLSKDKKWLIAAAGDVAFLWNTVTKKRLDLHQTGNFRMVEAIGFSLENKLAITVSQEGEVKLWNTTGKDLGGLSLSTKVHRGLLSPDGKTMILASNDGGGIIHLPTLDTTWVHSNSIIQAIDLSSNGKYFATASKDYTAKIWTISGKLLMNLKHDQEVRDVKFSPNNTYLATASYDKTVKLWNIFNTIPIVLHHPEKVDAVLFSPLGNYVLSIDLMGIIRVWNLKGELIALFNCKAKKGRVAFVDNKRFAVSNHNKILFFDFSSKILIDQFKKF